jgi:putative membrane protein
MKVSWILALAAATAACSKKSEPAAAGSATTSPAGSATTTTVPPSPSAIPDGEIAAIVVAANQVDIDAGQLALTKSTNAEVKKLAERMVTDHTAVNKSAVELVTKQHIEPVQSDTSKSLAAGGAETRQKLSALEGAAFDKAYVDNEVAYHQAVIDVLKTKLIPSAQNKELKDALVGVAPAFDAHLEHAKQVQAALAGGGPVAEHEHAK